MVCDHCNGSGEIALWCSSLAYAAPGPVPDYARNVCAATCTACGGAGGFACEPVECDDDLEERVA